VNRSPIVLATTVFGTVGVLAFHPHAPTVTTATAATATVTPATTTKVTTTAKKQTGTSTATATGEAIPTQYGNAQVKVTVKAGKITAIQALQLQGNDPKSVQISSYAEPILQQEALKAQTADVDAVSGATFTSASYTQSLQSALDKLGFKAASRASLAVPADDGHFH
jgi:uncharacterized protein with FMN-binding domain